MASATAPVSAPSVSTAKRKLTRIYNQLSASVNKSETFRDPFDFELERDKLAQFVKTTFQAVSTLRDELVQRREECERLYTETLKEFQSAAESESDRDLEQLGEIQAYCQDKNFESMLDCAFGCISNLEGRLDELKRQAASLGEELVLVDVSELAKQLHTLHVRDVGDIGDFVTPRSQSVGSVADQDLPRVVSDVRIRGREIKLKDFYGDVCEFETFLEIFNLLVGDQSHFSDLEKLSILVSCCKGDAARALRMIPLKGSNYKLALTRLREQFQAPHASVILQRELDALPKASDNVTDLWHTLNDVETIIQRLKQLKVNVSNFRTVETIVAKFPPKLQEKVREREFEKGAPWEMDDLLVFISGEVKKQVHLNTYATNDHKSVSSRVLFVNSASQPQKPFRCACCDNEHSIRDCQDYPTTSDKFRRLRERGVCFICFQLDHSARDCKRSSCRRCGGKHHSALCPRAPISDGSFRNFRDSNHTRAESYNPRYRSRSRDFRDNNFDFRGRSRSRSRSRTRDFRNFAQTNFPTRDRGNRFGQRGRSVRFSERRVYFPSPPRNHRTLERGGVRGRGFTRKPGQNFGARHHDSQGRSQSPRFHANANTRVNVIQSNDNHVHSDVTSEATHTYATRQLAYDLDDCDRNPYDADAENIYVNSVQSTFNANSRLMTVPVSLFNIKRNQYETLFALLDSGADRSFITKEAADRLGLIPCETRNINVTTFGGDQKSCEVDVFTCDLFNADQNSISAQLYSHDKITEPYRCEALLPCDLEFLLSLNIHPGSLPLPNNVVIQPEILLGIDVFARALGDHAFSKEMPSGLVILNTFFGHVISGNLKTPKSVYSPVNFRNSDSFVNHALEIQDLSDLWKLEHIGIRDEPDPDIADELIVRKFNETVRFDGGRISVSFPWRKNRDKLSDNFRLALSRLHQQFALSVKDPALWQKYCDIFEDQLSRGIIEEVTSPPPIDSSHSPCYYIPHHSVLKPGSNTTKVRIVLDASSKMKGELSLNDVIYQGPLILPNLCGVLLRARCGENVLIGDVEKAFHMIQLNESERDSTRFLWLYDVNKPPTPDNLRVMRFRRLPFGINASPFLLAQSIQWAMTQHSESTVCSEISRNLYVDNVVFTGDSTSELFEKYRKSKAIFCDMAMNLREFDSSDRECVQRISEIAPQDLSESKVQKLLGIKWDVIEDSLALPASFPKCEYLTKRLALKYCHSIFDPLGFLVPLLLPFKLFLQELWMGSYTWDEFLPPELTEKWNSLCDSFPSDFSVNIPRKICRKADTSVKYEIHVFVDASSRAYATCAYLQILNESSSEILDTNLLMARSRLTPVKEIKTLAPKPQSKSREMTIPRLELTALQCGAVVSTYLCDQLDIPVSKIKLYCDNMAALIWVKCDDKNDVYVRNRVTAIRERIHQIRERKIEFGLFHVPTAHNPADCATRGLTPSEFASHYWFKGPEFLRSSVQCEFPEFCIESSKSEVQVNLVKTSVSSTEANIPQFPFPLSCSSWTREKRAGAYVFRFLRHVFRKASTKTVERLRQCFPENDWTSSCDLKSPLTSSEIQAGEKLVIRGAQSYDFARGFGIGSGINQFRSLHNLKYGKQFNVVPDSFGLYRCAGRLHHSFLPYDTQFPYIIQPNNPVIPFLLRDCHQAVGHLGASATLAKLRERFWVPRGRRQVAQFCKSCVKCRRFSARPFQYPHSPALPPGRVVPSRPFSQVGLDYAGPFNVRSEDGSVNKRWICLFTCMSTRAVHLELASGLSAGEFLWCFRRFTSRRGVPEVIVSDNGTNFLASHKHVNHWLSTVVINVNSEKVQTFLANRNIEWRFITPLSPWKGGFYERLIGLVKMCLKKSIGRAVLIEQSFMTILTECEALVNCRPLSYVSYEQDNFTVLRPIDFLVPYARMSIIPPSREGDHLTCAIRTGQSYVEYFCEVNKYLERLWNLWSSHYLVELRNTHRLDVKLRRRPGILKPSLGDVVFVIDEQLDRGQWRLGMITELLKSSDGEIRSVTLRMPSGKYLHRSLAHLVPLEIRDEVVPCTFKHRDEYCEDQQQQNQACDSDGESVRVSDNSGCEKDQINPLRCRPYLERRAKRDIAYVNTCVGADFTSPFEELDEDHKMTYAFRARRKRFGIPQGFNPYFLLIMVTCLFPLSTALSVSCIQGGISIRCENNSPLSVCAASGVSRCNEYEVPTGNMSLQFDPDIVLHDYQVVVKQTEGPLTIVREVSCPPSPFCDQIRCNFCLILLANPSCWPYAVITVLGFVIYSVVLSCFCAFRSCRRLFRTCWRKTSSCLKALSRQEEEVPLLELNVRHRRGSVWKPSSIVRLLTIFGLVTLTDGCQQVIAISFNFSSCTSRDGDITSCLDQ